MDITSIITKVKASIDELIPTDYTDTNMDNIIKAKIGDAMRWVCLYASPSLLGGTSGCISEATGTKEVDLGSDCLRVLRVKGNDWSRAILKPSAEDSEEYMMQGDSNYPEAKATKERPLAVIVEGKTTKILGFPESSTLTIHYVTTPSVDTTSGSVSVPVLAESALIYYIAYLVLIAFNDTGKANAMLATAKMSAGITG